MPNSTLELLKDLGVFTVAALIIQKMIERNASRNLEQYKSELDFRNRNFQLTLDTDLEQFKARMNFQLKRQSSLHEKRLSIIDEMYRKLVTLDSAMRDMTMGHFVVEDAEKERLARVETAQVAFREYNNYYLYNKLYFNKEIEALLEKIRKDYMSANFDFFYPERLRSFTNGNPSGQAYQEALDTAQKAITSIQKEIPETLAQLSDEFRRLLGVEGLDGG